MTPLVLLAVLAGALSAVLALPRQGPLSRRADPPAGTVAADRGLSRTGLRLLAAGCAAVVVLLFWTSWPAVPVAFAVGGVVWVRSATWEPARVRAERARLAADLPHVVDLLTAAVASGASTAHAVSQISGLLPGPTGALLGGWSRRLAWGSDAAEVWAEMAAHPQFGRLGTVLLRSVQSGAPVLDALERLANDVRDQARVEVETLVRQVEVKAAAPLGLCLLPSFVLLGVVPLIAGSLAKVFPG